MTFGNRWNWTLVMLALMLIVFSFAIAAAGLVNEIPFGDWFSSGPGRTARKFSNFFAFIGAPIQVAVVSSIPVLLFGFVRKQWAPLCGLGLAIVLFIPTYVVHVWLAGSLLRIHVLDSLVFSWLTLIPYPVVSPRVRILEEAQGKETRCQPANADYRREARLSLIYDVGL